MLQTPMDVSSCMPWNLLSQRLYIMRWTSEMSVRHTARLDGKEPQFIRRKSKHGDHLSVKNLNFGVRRQSGGMQMSSLAWFVSHYAGTVHYPWRKQWQRIIAVAERPCSYRIVYLCSTSPASADQRSLQRKMKLHSSSHTWLTNVRNLRA